MTKPCFSHLKSHLEYPGYLIPHLGIFFPLRPTGGELVLEPLLSCREQLLEVFFKGECFLLEFNFLRPKAS